MRKLTLQEFQNTSYLAGNDADYLETLRSSLESCLASRGIAGQVLHSLSRDEDESNQLATNLAGTWVYHRNRRHNLWAQLIPPTQRFRHGRLVL